MRPAEPLRQIRHVGGEVGRNAERLIARANLFDILLAALLGHLQAAAEMFGQQGEALGNDFRQD